MTLPEYFVDLGNVDGFSNLSNEVQYKLLIAALKIHATEESLATAQLDYERAETNYRDACLVLADDDDDDFETRLAKAEKWRRIERDFTQASQRLGFEIREVAKSGRLIKLK